MALTTNIPPQAYTRDTLVKAIEWVSTQPPSVRERASSADLVVSFYLQACRKAAVQMEAPVSGENFKSDLKHLAEDLKKFDEPSASPHHSGRLSAHDGYQQQSLRPLPQTPPETYFAPPEPIFKPEPRQQELRFEMPPPAAPRVEPQPQFRAEARPENVAPPKSATSWPVDARSQHAARELQQKLNLSTETEALRMLVTLGAEAAKKLFP